MYKLCSDLLSSDNRWGRRTSSKGGKGGGEAVCRRFMQTQWSGVWGEEDLMATTSASSLSVSQGRGDTHLCKAASEAAAGIAEMVENYNPASQWVAAVMPEDHDQEKCLVYETCECCGLSEECTPAYAERMRGISCGRFVCGLCAEAVKEEMNRMGEGTSMEDALRAHMTMCVQFKSAPRLDPVVHLASALRQILKRSVQESRSPKTTRTSKQWQRTGLSRSESCMDLRAAHAGPSSSKSGSN